ncbi:MAG: 1,4-alpha-glucan branching protein GlgB [Ruminococcaceae bacterium]|nr:1,4-alpha-glucan branching protein GlgB [Oscillospiraceae bacterium]
MNEEKDMAPYYFHQGTNFYVYNYLGCNLKKIDGKYEYTFRTWAPNADKVGLVSDFTDWENPIYFNKITNKGVWECKYINYKSLSGKAYKFLIERDGRKNYKGDPYARFSRGGADGASIIFEDSFSFTDSVWMKKRRKDFFTQSSSYLSKPLNIYEIHFGSFIRHADNEYLTYREMADILVPYIKYMGYTHVEFLPLTEYPYDGSWGYQVCGFYAPTSRYGTPDDFKYLINKLHLSGIGVILDWVPAHFPKDSWGLYEFDGAPLYEYQGEDRIESDTWGTRFFDLGREEVQSFLISSAMFFLREYHIDGLRVDAVASMLYLDYDRKPGHWIPNSDGGRENLEAIAFFKKLNTAVYSEFSDVLMIAEESGSFGGVTKPVCCGGLGFALKWNMGFANDLYDYLSCDPFFRKYKHKALNFPILYAFSENYILPVSHDEVVHGKLSLIDKMFGGYEDKFRQMRSFLLMLMTYPGKKLLFMGTEFAQFREWDFENSLEWFMLDYPSHRKIRDYTRALNYFYLERPELWECDFDSEGFEWILPDAKEINTIAYKRFDKKRNSITVIINFSGSLQSVDLEYEVDVMFSTGEGVETEKIQEGKIRVFLKAFSGAVFKTKEKNIKIKL